MIRSKWGLPYKPFRLIYISLISLTASEFQPIKELHTRYVPFSPNVVPAPSSDSVALLISSQNHIPFGRSFSCKRQNKSRYTDIKNRRELCSRFKMMFYVTALKFKTILFFCPSAADSTKQLLTAGSDTSS